MTVPKSMIIINEKPTPDFMKEQLQKEADIHMTHIQISLQLLEELDKPEQNRTY